MITTADSNELDVVIKKLVKQKHVVPFNNVKRAAKSEKINIVRNSFSYTNDNKFLRMLRETFKSKLF